MTFLHRKEGNSPSYINRRCTIHPPKQPTPSTHDRPSGSNIYNFLYVSLNPAFHPSPGNHCLRRLMSREDLLRFTVHTHCSTTSGMTRTPPPSATHSMFLCL